MSDLGAHRRSGIAVPLPVEPVTEPDPTETPVPAGAATTGGGAGV